MLSGTPTPARVETLTTENITILKQVDIDYEVALCLHIFVPSNPQQFEFLPFEGCVNLSAPDHVFSLLVDYGDDPNAAPPNPERLFFGRLVRLECSEMLPPIFLVLRLINRKVALLIIMNWSFLLDCTWATSLVKAVFSKDEAFYWKHIHGSSTFLHNGQPRTGTIIRTDKFNFL